VASDEYEGKRINLPSIGIAVSFAIAALVIHVLTNGRYGYFRDELYFLAASDHLAWGYVDFAPLIALMTRIGRALFGDSLQAIRFFPSLAGAFKVFLTGLIAHELGGRRFAIALACLCSLVAPVFLGNDYKLSMNAYEALFWMGSVYVLILAIKRNQPKRLVWLGVLAGLGLENKHSMAFFGFALVVGLLLTSQRRLFASKWMWIAGAIALLLFLPNLIWQYQHDWPTLEDLSNVRRTHKNVELPPLAFLTQQVMMLSPASVIVWVAGIFLFFFAARGRRFRALGWTYVVFLAVMMVLKAKNYYLAPIYPMLFAAGGVMWEELASRTPRLAWAKPALLLVVAAFGAITAPFAIPILSVDGFLRYQERLGVRPEKTEVGHVGVLPQHYGDQFGWPEMVATVARIYHSLPPEEQARTAILAGNYGEAGAIDFFGPRYGLPKAISGHQNYYFWGPRHYTGESLILLQWSQKWAERACTSVQEEATLDPPYAMQEEHYTIYLCRGLKIPMPEFWRRIKHWN
jgi:hypothetical protein